MKEDLRLVGHPFLEFKRGEKISFTFNGKKIVAYGGETIASAAYAAGAQVFSRSFKYHRPRGLFCLRGSCPNCLMRINGIPHARVCMEPAKDGLIVKAQNTWPSLSIDFNRWIEAFDFMFRIGFQYKRFIRPRFLWPIIDRVIRKTAGIGVIPPTTAATSPPDYQKLSVNADVAVIGGGPSGMTAAKEAAKMGAKVLLIDDNSQLGGHLRLTTRELQQPAEYRGERAFRVAEKLSREAHSLGIDILLRATAFGHYADDKIAIRQQDKMIELSANRVIVATGSYERPMLFDNNDLPGVFLSTGVERLMNVQGVRPGRMAVVVGSDPNAITVAEELLDAQVELNGVAVYSFDTSRFGDSLNRLRGRGIPIYHSHTIKKAYGNSQVIGAELVRIDSGSEPEDLAVKLKCDLICTAGGFYPSNELLHQAGCQMRVDLRTENLIPDRDKNMKAGHRIFAVGGAGGTTNLERSLLEARIAGIRAALEIGKGTRKDETVLGELKQQLQEIQT